MRSIKCFPLLSIIILHAAFLTGSLQAQGGDDDLPTPHNEDPAPKYFVAAVGVTGGILLYDLDPLNQSFAAGFIPKGFTGNAWTREIQMLATVPWIDNVRIAPLIGWTSQTAASFDTTIGGEGVRRSLGMSATHYGLGLGYAFASPDSRYAFIAGLDLAGGQLDVHASQGAAHAAFSMADDFNQASPRIAHDYYAPFFLARPQVAFEWEPIHYVMLRAFAGYQLASVGSWKVDDDIPSGTAPALDTVSMSGFVGGLGLFFGFFF
jgi:hypothetical protein